MQKLLRLALLMTGCAVSQAHAAQTPAIGAKAVLEDHYPERRIQFSDGVVGLPDLTYSIIQGYRPLRLDLYRQSQQTSPRPLVVYVHGGGWREGHTRNSGAFENFPGVLASLAARGYVVASVEYRLSGEAHFPAALQDVKAAIRWLREHAGDYGIDATRAVVWGGSAGGQLAALTGVTCDAKSKAECVQGVVAWYGVFDFTTLDNALRDPRSAPAQYFGCTAAGCDQNKLRAASAIHFVDASDPPMLLIHGDRDHVVPVEQSRRFYKALSAKGVKAELVEISGADHSFVGATQDATRQASLQALEKTFEFIDRTLGVTPNR
jgi:acetyl esterase/lipase